MNLSSNLFYESQTPARQALPSQPRGARIEISPEDTQRLRSHVINLNDGRLSDSGDFKTSESDVDRLVTEELVEWCKTQKGDGKQPRIVLFAHGGLVSEKKGLSIVVKHLDFWLDNGIYPIYFVWETGIWETLRNLWAGRRRETPGARGVVEQTTDRLLERVARSLGGKKIWGGMKRSAERASDDDGGATYFIETLRDTIRRHKQAMGDPEIHAAGHSAGSIFHCHLIPVLTANNGPAVQTLHFLAPAVRVDLFKGSLLGLVDRAKPKVKSFLMYTMADPFEKDDNVIKIYRKSLLYLIHRALEPRRKTPILGLERSIRRDQVLVKLFGLGGATSAAAKIVFSRTEGDSNPPNASDSDTHGGFDDDIATMDSVVMRIAGAKAHSDIHSYAKYAQAARALEPGDSWENLDGWEELEEDAVASRSVVMPGPRPMSGKIALCIGINDYPTAPLYGCVADARSWHGLFTELGFETLPLMLDERASRSNIVTTIEAVIRDASPGDVIAIQYSGHGTQFDDVSGDEAARQGPGAPPDSVIVPHDYQTGAMIIDDEIGAMCDQMSDGVDLTLFFDCCHSGTMNRFFFGGSRGRHEAPRDGDSRQRYLVPDEALDATVRNYFSGSGKVERRRPIREVAFGACRDTESAWETNGSGDYTSAVIPLVREIYGRQGSIADLRKAIGQAFEGNRRQQPQIGPTSTSMEKRLMRNAVGGDAGGLNPGLLPQLHNLSSERLREIRKALDLELRSRT